MRTDKQRARALASAGLLAVMGLLAAACGDDGDDDTTTTTEAPSGTGTTAAANGDGEAGDEEWEAVIAAAQEEGAVTLYHQKADENAAAILAAFEDKYGIPGTAVRATGGALIQRIDQELAAGQLNGDVVLFGDVHYPEPFRDAGLLFEATGPAAEDYPPEMLGDGIVTVGNTPLAILYNTDTFPTPPESWRDFVQPGTSVGLTNPETTNNWAALYSLIKEHVGEDFLESLAGLRTNVQETSVTLVQSIAAGELDWTPFGFSYNLNQFAGTDAPIDIVYPDPTFMFTQVGFVHREAAHPNAGRLLLDFLMSEEGQAILNGNNEGMSPLDDVEGTVQVPDDVEVIAIDLAEFSEEDFAAIKEEWRSLFA